MTNKKFMRFLLVAQILCFALIISISAYAAPDTDYNLSFTLESNVSKVNNGGNTVINAGDSFDLNLNVDVNTYGFVFLIAEVEYDQSYLTYNGYDLEESAFYGEGRAVTVNDVGGGVLKIVIGDLNSMLDPNAEPIKYDMVGTVVTLSFTLVESYEGTSAVALKVDSGNIADSDGNYGSSSGIVLNEPVDDGEGTPTYGKINIQHIDENQHECTWMYASCTAPRICSVCNATEGEALGHSWSSATCTAPSTCSVCNATEGEALGHSWSSATCTAPSTCSVCNATEGEALGHSWSSATCTAPSTCSVCNATEGEALGHSWSSATCTTPSTCSVCNATEGEALGHSWADATCTTPKTCTVCDVTEGAAKGHTSVIDSSVEPTYSEEGKTQGAHCETCGEILEEQEIIPKKSSAWIWIVVISSVVVIGAGVGVAFVFIKKKKSK